MLAFQRFRQHTKRPGFGYVTCDAKIQQAVIGHGLWTDAKAAAIVLHVPYGDKEHFLLHGRPTIKVDGYRRVFIADEGGKYSQ